MHQRLLPISFPVLAIVWSRPPPTPALPLRGGGSPWSARNEHHPFLLARLEALARLLGARPRRVRDEQRAAYHAAASLAANLLVALADQSRQVFESVGWSEGDALDAVRSLMRGSLEALDAVGLPEAQSGPVRRGDAGTVARHVTALEGVAGRGSRAEPLEVYRVLGRAALDVAVRCGLEAGPAARIEAALAAGPAAGPLQPR
jgi:predicted short-subunit dehydrogenase-like oxidoreductase (DUF2520 family)